jgi:polyisoprenoid-binding protein YceI
MRKLHIGIAAAAASLLSIAAVTVNAQGGPPQLPGAHDASRVTGGTYTTDPNHSQVLYSYPHFGLTTNMGLLSGATGSLTLDPKAPNDAKLSVDVPIKTIHTTIDALDKELVGPMFFDAEKFPTAHFESTSVAAKGESAKIMGNLTIHGVTKPAEIDATFQSAGANPFSKKETVVFEGMAKIKRSDFGVSQFVPMVSDEITLKIMVAFEK